MDYNLQERVRFTECKRTAIKRINICMHPECKEKSINSHILMKNGILSSLANNGHVYQMGFDFFKENVHVFERIGINKAYSFNCFCNKHDTELFKEIETQSIDFSKYRTFLLFTLRTIYNEKFKKMVNLQTYGCMNEKYHGFFHKKAVESEKLGLQDIMATETIIWNDLNNGTESFDFYFKTCQRQEVCIASFYTYETTMEINQYQIENGRQMDKTTDIFINYFPFQSNSILLMGHLKTNNNKVKAYVKEIIKGSCKRLERKLTNLMLFQCETWVISENLYKTKFMKIEGLFGEFVRFSHFNFNERRLFDLNIFNENFINKAKSWVDSYCK